MQRWWGTIPLVPTLITLIVPFPPALVLFCPAYRWAQPKPFISEKPPWIIIDLLLTTFCVCRSAAGCSLTVPTTSTAATKTEVELQPDLLSAPTMCFTHLSSICGSTFQCSGAELQHQHVLQVTQPRGKDYICFQLDVSTVMFCILAPLVVWSGSLGQSTHIVILDLTDIWSITPNILFIYLFSHS